MYNYKTCCSSYDIPGSFQELQQLKTKERKRLIIDLMAILYEDTLDWYGGYPEQYWDWLEVKEGYVCYFGTGDGKGSGLQLYTHKKLQEMFKELCWYMEDETNLTEEKFAKALYGRISDVL